MEPTQPINSHFTEENFLQALPQDALGEIASHLAKEHLGNLASVCQFFNTREISDLMWKTLAQEQLPIADLKAGIVFKEKLKSYHDFVHLALKNADRVAVLPNKRKENMFSGELVLLLNDQDISLRDKYAAIRVDPQLVKMAHYLSVFSVYPGLYSNDPSVIKDSLEAFDLALKLVDINIPLPGHISLISASIAGKKEEVTKKIIDAGFDFFSRTEEFLDNLQKGAFEKEFFDKIADYAAEKLANKM